MNHSIRNYIILGLLLLLNMTAGAADTLKINLTYKHKLNAKGQTQGYMTIKQQFYTPEGVLFREISYDENTGQLSGYVFYFYRNGMLFTQEFYNKSDSLQYIIKHEYDQAGNEIVLTKLVPVLNDVKVVEKTINTYGKDRKLLQQKIIYGRLTGTIIRYQYNASGLLKKEKNTSKPVAKVSFKQETKDYSYSPDERISQVTVTGKDLSGKTYLFREEYVYNDKGLLLAVKKINIKNAQSGEKNYKYLNSGAVSIYEEHDAEGKLMVLLQYDYKKHFMDKGTQVSYYENIRNK